MSLFLKNEYLTIEFKNLGGELASIKDRDGVEYLWQGDSKYWSGQAPVLFPICGSLREDQTIYGKNGSNQIFGCMPRHGLVRKKNFVGEVVSENTIVFQILSDETMFQAFPYKFELSVFYQLVEKTLTITYEVKNLEKSYDLPFTIGAHPAFNCPLFPNEKYEDYSILFSDEESCTSAKVFPETGLVDLENRQPFLKNENKLNLDYELFKDDTVLLDRLKSKSITLTSKNHSKEIKINLLDFPILVLWSTANKSPFIALEPWLGVSTSKNESDYFEEKYNTQFASPFQKGFEVKSYSYQIQIK